MARALALALAFWAWTEALNPTHPWRPPMVYFGLVEALAQEAHWRLVMPPTVTQPDAEAFLREEADGAFAAPEL